MGITFTLPVPLRSQLGERTSDGQPNENDHYNCVATSLGVALEYLLKRLFNGDELKDAVYGQGYRGTMAAVAFIAYCARLGVDLVAIDGTQDQLMAALEREIRAGHPCLITMPSQWGSAPSQPGWDPVHPIGWTHVGVACGYGPGWLRIMNDWGGFWHDGTLDYWRPRLCYGQVWRVALKQGATKMAWHVGGDGWGTDDKGHRAGPGIVAGLQSAGWMGVDALAPETPYDGEGSMYIALANHHTVEWSKTSGTTVDQAAPALIAQAATIADLQRQLDEAKKQQNAPLTPYQQACIAAAEADMAATSALASATALRGK